MSVLYHIQYWIVEFVISKVINTAWDTSMNARINKIIIIKMPNDRWNINRYQFVKYFCLIESWYTQFVENLFLSSLPFRENSVLSFRNSSHLTANASWNFFMAYHYFNILDNCYASKSPSFRSFRFIIYLHSYKKRSIWLHIRKRARYLLKFAIFPVFSSYEYMVPLWESVSGIFPASLRNL